MAAVADNGAQSTIIPPNPQAYEKSRIILTQVAILHSMAKVRDIAAMVNLGFSSDGFEVTVPGVNRTG